MARGWRLLEPAGARGLEPRGWLEPTGVPERFRRPEQSGSSPWPTGSCAGRPVSPLCAGRRSSSWRLPAWPPQSWPPSSQPFSRPFSRPSSSPWLNLHVPGTLVAIYQKLYPTLSRSRKDSSIRTTGFCTLRIFDEGPAAAAPGCRRPSAADSSRRIDPALAGLGRVRPNGSRPPAQAGRKTPAAAVAGKPNCPARPADWRLCPKHSLRNRDSLPRHPRQTARTGHCKALGLRPAGNSAAHRENRQARQSGQPTERGKTHRPRTDCSKRIWKRRIPL